MEFVSFVSPTLQVANTEYLDTLEVDPEYSGNLDISTELYRVFLKKGCYAQAVFATTGLPDEDLALKLLSHFVPDFEPDCFEINYNSIVLHADRSGGYDT